jgi:hypothetical protein
MRQRRTLSDYPKEDFLDFAKEIFFALLFHSATTSPCGCQGCRSRAIRRLPMLLFASPLSGSWIAGSTRLAPRRAVF